MACLANTEKNCTYQGRTEGAIRKCHRLSVRADYLERCERFQGAVDCHQVASEALQAYLKSQISVASRRQVELLIRRHQTRIFYLRRREEERKHEPSSPQLLSASFSEAGDENARLYFSHSPAMLQEIKKCQVQFNNAMEQLHSLVNPEELTRQIEVSDLMTTEDKALAKAEKASRQDAVSRSHEMSTKTGVDAAESAPTDGPLSSEPSSHCAASNGGCAGAPSSGGGMSCKQCGKSFDTRLREEECMLRLAGDLPSVWRAKDRTLLGVLADYSRMAKARDTLQDQVKQLTFQLEQVRCQAEQQAQLMSCSNITYNTTDPDPADLTTSDTQDNTGEAGGYLGVLGGGVQTSTCSGSTSEFHHVQQQSSSSNLGSGYSYGGGSVTLLDHPQQTMAGGSGCGTSLTSSGYDQITSAMEKMACAAKGLSAGGPIHPFGGGTPVKADVVFESLDRRGVGFAGFSSRGSGPRNGDYTSPGLPKLESSFSVAEQDFPPLHTRGRNDGR